jgi:hypothetical protein
MGSKRMNAGRVAVGLALWGAAAAAQPAPNSVDCDALRRNPDGTWTALRSVTIVIGQSRVGLGQGNSIGRRSINVNNTDVAEFLEQACPAPRNP